MTDQILSPYGQVLYVLYKIKKPLYSKQIAEQLGTISQMTVGEKLREMEEQKIVDREEIANIVRYKLNATGIKYAKEMENEFHKTVNLEKLEADMKKSVLRTRKAYPSKIIRRISSGYRAD